MHRGVVDRLDLPVQEVVSPATFGAGGDLVPDPYVRERAPSHDAVVPPSRAVAVEHRLLDPVAEEVTAGRRVWCDDTGR